ncbi:FliM/FliN family flagellar motor C-terminal domain-containing protein [Sulfitobacter sp. THAF37]|uniref:FliM/FliN family flagellar motor switch protein n=1 Tax=Sulfitobacter sp. THAF37 TaxID=2587855 RepID=UPI001562D769|nr:FliM/FliN family flagellar motor C-terminal domain-containing protein [Sulfitobacter sp. THAF37]
MTLPKALRLGLAKAGDDLMDLALAALAIRVEEVPGDAIQDCLDARNLLMLLDGPGGRPAAAILDPLLVGALLQQQTMARVLPDAGGEPRQMTNTDAAVTAPFVDALIARAAALPDNAQDRRLVEGYSFGSRVESPRLLALALEEPEYRLISLTVDIAGGVRQGQIQLVLPLPVAEDASAPAPAPGAAAPAQAAPPVSLGDTALSLEVGLQVALTRLRLPLAHLGRLRVGDVLPLDGARFDRAEVLNPAGGRLARGVLGQMDGCRALRIVPQEAGTDAPRRRSTDRADLAQAEPAPLASEPVIPAGPETQTPDPDPAPPPMPDLSDLPELDLPPLDGLPDLDDLPDLDGLPDLKVG